MAKEQLHLITTVEDVRKLMQYLIDNKQEAQSESAYDLETTSLDVFDTTVMGIAVACFEDEGFYVALNKYVVDERDAKGIGIAGHIEPVISDGKVILELLQLLKEFKLIMHNAPFDVLVTKYSMQVDYTEEVYIDTQMLKHTVNPDKPHGLKPVSAALCGLDATEEQTKMKESVIRNGGRWTEEHKDMYMADYELLGYYGAKDACLTMKIKRILLVKLKELNLEKLFFDDIVMPLLKEQTIPMKELGFNIDVEYFQDLEMSLDEKTQTLQEQLYEEIQDDIESLESLILEKDVKATNTATSYCEALCRVVGLTPPVNPKTGSYTFAKGAIDKWTAALGSKVTEDQLKVMWFVAKQCDKVPTKIGHQAKLLVWCERNPNKNSPFNIGSDDQLGKLAKLKWGLNSPKTTKSGDPSYDQEVLEAFSVERIQALQSVSKEEAKQTFDKWMDSEDLDVNMEWFCKLLKLRKWSKLLDTYVRNILRLQRNGKVHADAIQSGTSSGRYALKNPNLQNLPAHSITGQVIKRGFSVKQL
jgi:DNA polymerase I-like protein with 3'-5' exonuclease and polymerase domains